MKFEITEKGVYDEGGKRVPVGTVIDLEDNEVPTFLKGKGRKLHAATAVDDADEGGMDDGKKSAVVNPAKKSA